MKKIARPRPSTRISQTTKSRQLSRSVGHGPRGEGGKQVKPVKGSYVKGYIDSHGISKVTTQKVSSKVEMKSKTSVGTKAQVMSGLMKKALNKPTMPKVPQKQVQKNKGGR